MSSKKRVLQRDVICYKVLKILDFSVSAFSIVLQLCRTFHNGVEFLLNSFSLVQFHCWEYPNTFQRHTFCFALYLVCNLQGYSFGKTLLEQKFVDEQLGKVILIEQHKVCKENHTCKGRQNLENRSEGIKKEGVDTPHRFPFRKLYWQRPTPFVYYIPHFKEKCKTWQQIRRLFRNIKHEVFRLPFCVLDSVEQRILP